MFWQGLAPQTLIVRSLEQAERKCKQQTPGHHQQRFGIPTFTIKSSVCPSVDSCSRDVCSRSRCYTVVTRMRSHLAIKVQKTGKHLELIIGQIVAPVDAVTVRDATVLHLCQGSLFPDASTGQKYTFLPCPNHDHQQLPLSQSARPISRQNTQQREGCMLQKCKLQYSKDFVFPKWKFNARNVKCWVGPRKKVLCCILIQRVSDDGGCL